MKKEIARKYSEFIQNNTRFHSWAEIYGGEWVVTVHCYLDKQTMKETLNSLYGAAAAELHPEYFDTDSVTGGAEQ